MRRFWMGAIAALALAGCQDQAELSASDAWVRLPAAAGRPGAAYFTLHGGAAPATLVAVSAPFAGSTELHETMPVTGSDMDAHGGHMMTMAPVAQVAVPARGEVKFAPGGKHVMLFDVAATLKPGGTAPITLRFADGKKIEATAKIVGAGDPPPG